MPSNRTTWKTSLHLTFRLLPEPTPNLRPFLLSEGQNPTQVLSNLPYDVARAVRGPGSGPDPRRYRDGKQLYQTCGILYEDTDRYVRITELGKTTSRWLDLINEKNAVILGKHAAYALAACQLRNPTGDGSSYDSTVNVFPFAFIWRAMLALDAKINSIELSRALFKVKNEDDLAVAIDLIRQSRQANDVNIMGAPVETHNDRIIPWMSLASFGWTLIQDKRSGSGFGNSYYVIPDTTIEILEEAASIRHEHKEFESVEDYVKHISRAAALPIDLR